MQWPHHHNNNHRHTQPLPLDYHCRGKLDPRPSFPACRLALLGGGVCRAPPPNRCLFPPPYPPQPPLPPCRHRCTVCPPPPCRPTWCKPTTRPWRRWRTSQVPASPRAPRGRARARATMPRRRSSLPFWVPTAGSSPRGGQGWVSVSPRRAHPNPCPHTHTSGHRPCAACA